MELKIITTENGQFNAALGINDMRARELLSIMDEIGERLLEQSSNISDELCTIVKYCNTFEEAVFCAFTHGSWMQDNNLLANLNKNHGT